MRFKQTWLTTQLRQANSELGYGIGNPGAKSVFNIKGNDYRLIVAMAYKMQHVFIKFIGTHTQYDAVDAASVDQFK